MLLVRICYSAGSVYLLAPQRLALPAIVDGVPIVVEHFENTWYIVPFGLFGLAKCPAERRAEVNDCSRNPFDLKSRERSLNPLRIALG